MITLKSGATIVPMRIDGSNALWSCFLRRRRLSVSFAPPIRLPDGYEPYDPKIEYDLIGSMIYEEIRMLEEEQHG